MLIIGSHNDLEVSRISPNGVYLASEVGEILLPNKYAGGLQPGNIVKVFVYLDSEDRLIATTRTPKACVGEFACLTVKEVSSVGAFLDWGLEKDLLVPFNEQPSPMRAGENHVVRVYLDNSGRIAASGKLSKFLETTSISLKIGEEVDLMIHEITELGAKVIINNRYAGLLFRNELFGNPEPGRKMTGYVSKIRDDNKIDVTLRQRASQELSKSKSTILKALETAGGFLPLGDKSSPESISSSLAMSKKAFKKAVGNLYKEGIIVLAADEIRIKKPGRR